MASSGGGAAAGGGGGPAPEAAKEEEKKEEAKGESRRLYFCPTPKRPGKAEVCILHLLQRSPTTTW